MGIEKRIADIIRAANKKFAPEGVHPDTMGEIIARELGLVQFWAVAYGDGYHPEESYEQRDLAQERTDDAIDAGDEDAKLITTWFMGWRDETDLAPVLLS